jgi:hypothetical protein
MTTYITLFDSIASTYKTFSVPQEHIEKLQNIEHPFPVTKADLVSAMYNGLRTNMEEVYYPSSIFYLLQSHTYRVGQELGSNSYYFYVSRGNGTGYVRACGSLPVRGPQEARESAPTMTTMFMEMFGETSSMERRTIRGGSNVTPKKKKRK